MFRLNRKPNIAYICCVIVKLLSFILPLAKVVLNPSRTTPDRRSRLKRECRGMNIEFNRIRKIKNLAVPSNQVTIIQGVSLFLHQILDNLFYKLVLMQNRSIT